MKQPIQLCRVLGRVVGFVLGYWLCGSGLAHAVGDSFYCPKNMRLVQKGDAMKTVVEKCGDPKEREDLFSLDCDEETGNCYRIKIGERWIYDFGRTYLTKILFFRYERLSAIAAGFYGENP